MSRVLDQYHPRHYQSPIAFSTQDKALLLKSTRDTVLLVDANVRISSAQSLTPEIVKNAHGLGLVFNRLSPKLSPTDILAYFKGKHRRDESESIDALYQALARKQLVLYRWPHGMERPAPRSPSRYDANGKPPEMPESTLGGIAKRVGGYVAPHVPTLAELDDIVGKIEKLRNMDKNAMAQQALAMARQNIPDEIQPQIDQINDIAAAAAQGADTQALVTDAALNAVGTTLSGQPALAIAQTRCEGEPISLVTGEELLKLTDLQLEGPLPLTWWRVYRSSNPNDDGLGHGWSHSLNEWLTLDASHQQLQLHDAEGRLILLPLPAVGEKTHNTAERLSILRESETRFVLTPYSSPYGLRRYFELDATDARYRLSAIQNSHKAGYQLHYVGRQLREIRGSQGDCLRLNYTDCGHIAELIRNDGNGTAQVLVSYRYDTQSDLIQASDADGYAERYTYKQHIISKRQLKSGYCFYFEWDQLTPQARCLRQYGQMINQQPTYDYRFEWDAAQGRVTVTDTLGAEHSYRHNAQGKLIYHKDAEGHETHYHHNDDGQLTTTDHPDGSQEHISYNLWGQATSVTNTLGHHQTTEYDEQGRIFATAHHGVDQSSCWEYHYNDHNQLIRITNPVGQHTDYTYNILGLIGTITHAGVQQVRYWWNERGQLTQQQDAMARLSHYRYNAQQQLSEIQHPNGHSTHYRYNARGQLAEMIAPDQQHTQYTYTELGHLQSLTDPNGTVTTYAYDGLSQVTRRTTTDAHGQPSELHYRYDGERNLIGLINEKGEHYQLAYDRNERLIKEIGFDGRQTEYDYNALGHMIKKREYGAQSDAQPMVTEYQCNAVGQVLTQSNSDGITTLAYDRQGRLVQADNTHRKLRWEYNAVGQVTAEWQDEHVTRYQYNRAGQCRYIQLPNQQLIEWDYNPANQINAAYWLRTGDKHNNAEQHKNEQTTPGIHRDCLLSVRYHNDGRERLRDHGNRLRTLSVHTPDGRLASKGIVKHTAEHQQPADALLEAALGGSPKHYTGLQTINYQYSRAGQLIQTQDTFKGSARYHYDALDRLTHIEGNDPEYFVHDPAHNLLASASSQAEAEQQARQSQVDYNRLSVQGQQTFAYDAYGNRTQHKAPSDGATTYHYNAEHRLSESNNAQGRTRYTYDALGRRVQKHHRHSDGRDTHTDYLWQGDNLLQETQRTAGVCCYTQTYVFEPHSHRPVAVLKGEHAYRYHLDPLGTPEALSDKRGNVVWMAKYASYGKVVNEYREEIQVEYRHNTQNPEASLPEVSQPLRFQGQYFDEETSLHYNRHRYYDPSTGSYLTQDPIKLKGGMNNYRYVPNPVQWVDPLGLQNKEDHEGDGWFGSYTDTLGDMAKQTAAAQGELHESSNGWANVMQPIYKPIEGLGRGVGNTFGLLEFMGPNGLSPQVEGYWSDQWQGVKDLGSLAYGAATGDPKALAQLTPAIVTGVVLKKLPGKVPNSKTISASSPSEIAYGFGDLSKRQQGILDQLPSTLSSTTLHKKGIGVTDLAAMTARTGDEFALFTNGSQRLVVRGNPNGVPMTRSELQSLSDQGYKWSGHSHPGTIDFVLDASGIPGDRLVLDIFKQEQSLILNSAGKRNLFNMSDNIRID